MENSKLIHEFTDGTLEATNEPMLFNLLANDEELRHEFKQELAIKSAIRSDKKAFTPAAASTLGIFSSLGFVPPAAAVGSAVVGGIAAGAVKSAGILTNISASMITGIVATIATAVVSYFIFQPQIDDLLSNNNNLTSQISELKNKPEIPVMKSEEKNVEKISENANQPIVKYIYITKEVPANPPVAVIDNSAIENNQEISEQISEQNDKKLLSQTELSKTGIINSYEHQGFNINSPVYGNIQMLPMDFSDLLTVRNDLGITFEFNKMENWFEKMPTINPKQFSKFNNSSVSVLYNIFGGLYAGIQLRQETFFQSFNGMDKIGNLLNYQQQPNFTSVGLLMRYSNENYNVLGVYPYLQAYAGGTNVGPIGRMLLGLRYSPYKGIIFHVGAEYSNLWYQHQNKDYQTAKYDLNYGLSFEF